MKASPIDRLPVEMYEDIQGSTPVAKLDIWTYGPELLLVMVALLAVGLALGAFSPLTGVALLSGATGAVLVTSIFETPRVSIAERFGGK